jgi:hypothetical protein
MNGFAYWQYTLTAKAIVPKSPFRRQAAFTDSEDSAKGPRKNNFTFLMEPTCSSSLAKSCER